MSSLLLNAEELGELTGYKKPKLQIIWLRAQGFEFRVAADGHPRVDRSHYLKIMGGTVSQELIRKTEPNFDSLIKHTSAA